MARYKAGDYVRYVGPRNLPKEPNRPYMVMETSTSDWYLIRLVGEWPSFGVPESDIDDYSSDPHWDQECI